MIEGALYERILPDGRCINVIPLTYQRARLVISLTAKSPTYEDGY